MVGRSFATSAIRLVTLNVIVSLMHIVISIINLAMCSAIALLRKRMIQTKVNAVVPLVYSKRS